MSDALRTARQRINEALTIIDSLLGATPQGAVQDESGARFIERNGKRFVELENHMWFLQTCMVLKSHPLAEGRDQEALASLPSGLARYKSLTEGQWKLFKALHFKILGSWPEVPAAVAETPVAPISEDSQEDIPF